MGKIGLDRERQGSLGDNRQIEVGVGLGASFDAGAKGPNEFSGLLWAAPKGGKRKC